MLDGAVSLLIELGRRGDSAAPAALELTAAELLSREGRLALSGMARELSREHLEGLIRGLVLCGVGGSVSAVIPLFKFFAKEYPQDEPSLTSWIVANRVNPYDPFGTVVYNDASSLKEHLAQRRARDARAAANERQEDDRQRQSALRKGEIATTRLAAAVKRGDRSAVEALLAKGANPEQALPGGSLVALALEHGQAALAEFLKARGIG